MRLARTLVDVLCDDMDDVGQPNTFDDDEYPYYPTSLPPRLVIKEGEPDGDGE